MLFIIYLAWENWPKKSWNWLHNQVRCLELWYIPYNSTMHNGIIISYMIGWEWVSPTLVPRWVHSLSAQSYHVPLLPPHVSIVLPSFFEQVVRPHLWMPAKGEGKDDRYKRVAALHHLHIHAHPTMLYIDLVILLHMDLCTHLHTSTLQWELAIGTFPYGKWATIFELLNAVVNGPPPKLPDNGRYSNELQEFSTAW